MRHNVALIQHMAWYDVEIQAVRPTVVARVGGRVVVALRVGMTTNQALQIRLWM